MMSVKEYANDTNHTVAEILKKCEEFISSHFLVYFI